jgi:hypothetical protein
MSRWHHRRKSHGGLRVLQANVDRSPTAHDIALNYAFEADFQLVLLQEPWIGTDLTRRQTKTHPAFRTLIPLDNWIARPRVLTYLRRDTGYRVLQPTCGLSRDLLQLVLQQPGYPDLTVWNIYSSPAGSTDPGAGARVLQQQQLGPNTTVAGDFNLRHPSWDPARGTSPEGANIAAWAENQGLRLANAVGVSTHWQGGVLDLVFTTSPTTQATVATSLHTTSGHYTLQYTITGPSPPPSPPGRLRLNTVWDRPRFRTLLAHATQTTSEDLDTEAQSLVQTIHDALTGSAPRSQMSSTGARWWTEDCRTAAAAYRRARRIGPAEEEKRALRAAVRRAKRSYWRSRVEESDTLPKLYRVTNWHRHSSRYLSPPLSGPDGLITSPEGKQELLHQVLLSRHLDTEDVPYTCPAVPEREIEWAPLSDKEAFSATCQVTTTAPGHDEITAQVLREAWPQLGSRITTLFSSCLQLGHHPTAFKQAAVVVIPKPGDRNRTLPKSYRPIALLSCLGKGLERLIGRRLVYLALRNSILARDQCGATSRRAATDLTTALYSDIEDIWDHKQAAGMVTVDIRGAFDGVLPGRLLLRLRQQGWPPPLLAWVRSYLNGRTASITLDGATSRPFDVLCGLPQGSPVSPILFLLYVEPILKLTLTGCRGRFGYADDACFLGAGRDLSGCRLVLQATLDTVRSWGEQNGILFSEEKTELQYFTPRTRWVQHMEPIQAGDQTIIPNKVTR